MCESLYEGVVKVKKSHHLPYFCDVGWCQPHINSCDLYQVHACHPLFKDYPQVIHRWCMEEAFLRFEIEIMFICDTKNVLNCCDVTSHICSCSDTNVVHIDVDHGS